VNSIINLLTFASVNLAANVVLQMGWQRQKIHRKPLKYKFVSNYSSRQGYFESNSVGEQPGERER